MTKPLLDLITVSGAHGTGKSTLVSALTRAITPDRSCLVIPSMSDALFASVQSGQVKPPRDCRPRSYADIDEMGIRNWWQRALPGVLTNLVVELLDTKEGVMLVDRWFADIHAFTQIQVQDRLERSLLGQAVAVAASGLNVWLRGQFEVRAHHFLIPLASCSHSPGEEKPSRATCDPADWEVLLRYGWYDVMPAGSKLTPLLDRTVRGRVDEVLAALK